MLAYFLQEESLGPDRTKSVEGQGWRGRRTVLVDQPGALGVFDRQQGAGSGRIELSGGR